MTPMNDQVMLKVGLRCSFTYVCRACVRACVDGCADVHRCFSLDV